MSAEWRLGDFALYSLQIYILWFLVFFRSGLWQCWTFSFRFDIESVRYRSFIIEEHLWSLTSLATTNGVTVTALHFRRTIITTCLGVFTVKVVTISILKHLLWEKLIFRSHEYYQWVPLTLIFQVGCVKLKLN